MYEASRKRYSKMVLTSFGLTLLLYVLLHVWIAFIYPNMAPASARSILDSAPLEETVQSLSAS